MKILLRTPDIIRGFAEKFERCASHWSHHTRLKALAVMLGHASWEELVSSCDLSAPLFVFDQDLPSDAERHARWLAMAQQLAKSFGLPLVDALDLVHDARPTSKIGVQRSIWDEKNQDFLSALQLEADVWWVNAYHHGHPFSPPGFLYCEAVSVSSRAINAFSEGRGIYERRDCHSISILLPQSFYYCKTGYHLHLRRCDMLEVAPVPIGAAILFPKKYHSYLKEFFQSNYQSVPAGDYGKMIDNWKDSLKALFVSSGLSPNSKRQDIQFRLSIREAIGRDWYWPFIISENNQKDVLNKMRTVAIEFEDGLVKRGSNRGVVIFGDDDDQSE